VISSIIRIVTKSKLSDETFYNGVKSNKTDTSEFTRAVHRVCIIVLDDNLFHWVFRKELFISICLTNLQDQILDLDSKLNNTNDLDFKNRQAVFCQRSEFVTVLLQEIQQDI